LWQKPYFVLSLVIVNYKGVYQNEPQFKTVDGISIRVSILIGLRPTKDFKVTVMETERFFLSTQQ